MPRKKITNVKPDRMIVFEDLKADSTGDIFHDVGILFKGKSFIDRPDACPNCKKGNMGSVEILGAYSGTLLWDCDSCGYMFLRFSKKETETRLDSVKGTYTNPNDWGFLSRDEFS